MQPVYLYLYRSHYFSVTLFNHCKKTSYSTLIRTHCGITNESQKPLQLLVRAFTGGSHCLLILLAFQVENLFCNDRS